MEQTSETQTHTSGRQLAAHLFGLVAGAPQDGAEPISVPLGEGGGHFLADPTGVTVPEGTGAISDALSVHGTHVTADGQRIVSTLTFGAGSPDALTAAHVSPVEN